MEPLLKPHKLLVATSCALVLTACTTPATNVPSVSDMPPAINASGVMVGTASRMTLYTYESDAPNQSNCLDECAVRWPPLFANNSDASRGDFTVFTRPDGRKQWALMGKPLYFWSSEARPGDVAGEAFSPQWRAYRVGTPGK